MLKSLINKQQLKMSLAVIVKPMKAVDKPMKAGERAKALPVCREPAGNGRAGLKSVSKHSFKMNSRRNLRLNKMK